MRRALMAAAALARGLEPLAPVEKYPGQRRAYLRGAWRGDGVASRVRRRPRTNPPPAVYRGKPNRRASAC